MKKQKNIFRVFLPIIALLLSAGIFLSVHVPSAAEDTTRYTDGIRVFVEDADSIDDQTQDQTLIVNLKESVSLAGATEIVFEFEFNGGEDIRPFVITDKGEYFEFVASDGVSAEYVYAPTLSLLKNGTTKTAEDWTGVGNYLSKGKVAISFSVSDFYMRCAFDNYGADKENVAAVSKFGTVLGESFTVSSVGARISGASSDNADFIFGDVWLKTTEYEKICESENVSLNGITMTKNTDSAWLACFPNRGTHDAEGVWSKIGWLTPLSTDGFGTWLGLKAVKNGDFAGYFEGINYRMTDLSYSNYQKLLLPVYDGSFEDKSLVFEYYDRGNNSAKFEPKLCLGNNEYGLGNSKVYYVTPDFDLVKSVTASWSIDPPQGFVGYIVIDLSTADKPVWSENMHLMIGVHGDWNGGNLMSFDMGDVRVADGALSERSDFKSLIAGADVYFDFADEASPDGINGGFSMTAPTAHGVVISKASHLLNYSGASGDNVEYGLLDGVNFRIKDVEDNAFRYLYVKGYESDLSGADYFALRIADHSANGAQVNLYFYDSSKEVKYRSGVAWGKSAYLFDANGGYIDEIKPITSWSTFQFPARFNGYIVIDLDTVDWMFERTNATYFAIAGQGTQGVSNDQQGTLDTPESKGFDFEFGQCFYFSGTFTQNYDNFTVLMNGGGLYATTLANSRKAISSCLSGSTSYCTPVVSSKLDYSYMDMQGIIFDATENAGEVCVNVSLGASQKKLAYYVFNEKFEDMTVSFSYRSGNDVVYPSAVTLVSVFDETQTLSPVNGNVKLPDGFEGYILVDVENGSPVIGLEAGERLGLQSVSALTDVETTGISSVHDNGISLFKTVLMTDAEIVAVFEAEGVEIKRGVNSIWLTDDAPTNVGTAETFATVELKDGDDNYIYKLKDSYPIYKSTGLYEGTPTIQTDYVPSVIDDTCEYILFDEGETVEAEIKEAGVVYVFADKDFSADGFTKALAINSFIDGIEGRLFGYKKSFTKGETLSVSGAYLIVVNGEESEFVSKHVPTEIRFGEDIPEEYLLDNFKFFGCPAVEQVSENRMFIAVITGDRTEPLIDNVGICYVSEDGGKTMKPYALVDHPYETMARVLDPVLWLVDGKLWMFTMQANATFGNITCWGRYSTNYNAERIEDITWSEPIYLFDGLMNSKPTKLSDGSYIYNAALPEHHPSEVHVFKSTDGGLSVTKIGTATADPAYASDFRFTEAKIVEHADGTLSLLKRVDKGIINPEISYSEDGGYTWTQGVLVDGLKTGSSRFVYTKLSSGNILYVGNMGDANRSHLTALLSEDDGKTWPYALELDHRNWVSYPDLTFTADGDFYIAYDRGRAAEMEIRYAIFNEEDIKAGKFISENAVKMGLLIKSPAWSEITRVVTELDLSFEKGVTQEQILSSLPTEITVETDQKPSEVLSGSWKLANFAEGEVGEYALEFVTQLPSRLEDNYLLLQMTVTVEAPEAVPNEPVTPPSDGNNGGGGEASTPTESEKKKKSGCSSAMLNAGAGIALTLVGAVLGNKKRKEK
ncbi:MAG: exo-alpha-sialidase [Clostridia bacterium]|nr:exo-alpha-sialidase [Clostridia bacterium]